MFFGKKKTSIQGEHRTEKRLDYGRWNIGPSRGPRQRKTEKEKCLHQGPVKTKHAYFQRRVRKGFTQGRGKGRRRTARNEPVV